MKSTVAKLLIVTALCVSCTKGGPELPQTEDESGVELVGHDMIVLGSQLEDPYSVKNMTKALSSLYPTKADRVDIKPTNRYVRFLPSSEREFQGLLDLGLDLVDHPLDYLIVKDGDYYHDPGVDESGITWQYAVVDKDFEMPSWVQGEVLDECFIPVSGGTVRSDDGIDWDEVEREAFRLTGNEDLLVPGTKAAVNPSGRITIVDEAANGGKGFGVAGVKVVANVFVKFCVAATDRDGYYQMNQQFTGKVRYRLLFQNAKGFAIGFNMLLVPASTSALGKADAEGISVQVSKASDRKLYTRCVVNNAAYDYFERCAESDLNLTAPPQNLRFWLFQGLDASSAVMARHGAVVENSLFCRFLGQYASILELFLPDITIGLSGKSSYGQIYSEVCHEMAHASHFAKVGKNYWDKYVDYVIQSFVFGGGVTYGDGTMDGAGYCEIGEMWGYFMQNKMYNDRYGGVMPNSGQGFWFHPQIFNYLYERGLSPSQLFKAMTPTVHDREALRQSLLSLYPEKQEVINQVFDRYSE